MGRIAVALTGGTALGAVQVFSTENLLIDYCPIDIDFFGCSTGSITASKAAENRIDQLYSAYGELDGAKDFQQCNWKIWKGLFNLTPLYNLLAKYNSAGNLVTNAYVGIWSPRPKEYRNVRLNDLPAGHQRWQHVIASCSMPGIHRAVWIDDRWWLDGGVRNVIPDIGDPHQYDEIHVISCSPVYVEQRSTRDDADPDDQRKANTVFEQLNATFEEWTDLVMATNMRRVEEWSKSTPVKIYAPTSWSQVGRPFDASRETIHNRLYTVGPELWESRYWL